MLELILNENKLNKITTSLFTGLNRLEILRLDKNEIEEIESNAFENMNRLIELHLYSNRLKLIENRILFGKSNLKILYLYQNGIETLDTIQFNTLYSLQKLHICSNKIESINFGNFIHLIRLDELKLDKNEIDTFEANTFIGLENLSRLDLSANKIKTLKSRAFSNLINVKHLDLHLNDISRIEMKSLIDLESLSYLNLDSNKLSSLRHVQFNKKLNELSIRNNMLSNLSEINANSLKKLHASNNLIQTINLIPYISNLEYLDLSRNRLIKIDAKSFLNLVKLKYLNLSFNKLDLENKEYFKSQTNLECLDLSSNEIKYLDSNLTFKHLNSLQALNLSNNHLNSIEPFVFDYLSSKLIDLNLASNNLSQLSFKRLESLKYLKLSYNQLKSLDFLKACQNLTQILELDFNKIASIGEDDFDSQTNLVSLNLNSNPIKSIHQKAFERLVLIDTLKLSNSSLNHLFINNYLKELSLSYLDLTISNEERLDQLEWISLARTKINVGFDQFLNSLSRYVDFSFNLFNDFKMFKVLGPALEYLKLRQTNLEKIEQIDFKNLINLKHLDLSFNNLAFINQSVFEFALNLEYLDLGWNRLYEFYVDLDKLSYLSLENNQISFTKEHLYDYLSMKTLKMSNNSLKTYPSFEANEINTNNDNTFTEFYLDQNQIKTIKYFSFIFGNLKVVNFDSNEISFIENDAFLNCRSLEYLSISNNRLTNVTENHFHFLFSLTHLNLSLNEIEFIEIYSFKNLNKLKSLDLNYNRLKSIDNDLFVGLTNLNHLYLLSHGRNELTFSNRSFKHLPNISTIVLNESLIETNKCLFMYGLERDVQRNVANKYVFYKSINLLTNAIQPKCDLTFHMFQFKVHYNLRTDYENDLFFSLCQGLLIKRENTFFYNYRKCFPNFTTKNEKKQTENDDESFFILLKVLSNFYYLATMGLFLSLVIPVSCLILRFELCSCLFLNFTNANEFD